MSIQKMLRHRNRDKESLGSPSMSTFSQALCLQSCTALTKLRKQTKHRAENTRIQAAWFVYSQGKQGDGVKLEGNAISPKLVTPANLATTHSAMHLLRKYKLRVLIKKGICFFLNGKKTIPFASPVVPDS